MTEGKANKAYKPVVDDESVELVDIFAHFHPKRATITRPSIIDVINVNPKWKEFVFDIINLALFSEPKFHPITGLPWRREDRNQLTQNDVGYLRITSKSDDFDTEVVARMEPNMISKTWQEVSSKNPFTDFKI